MSFGWLPALCLRYFVTSHPLFSHGILSSRTCFLCSKYYVALPMPRVGTMNTIGVCIHFFFLPVMVHYCSAYFRVKSQHEYAPNTAGCFHRSSCLIISTCAVFSATFILKMRKLSVKIFFFLSHMIMDTQTFLLSLSVWPTHLINSSPLMMCTKEPAFPFWYAQF